MIEASVVEHRSHKEDSSGLDDSFWDGRDGNRGGRRRILISAPGRLWLSVAVKCKVCVRQFLLFFTILSNQS